MILTVILMNKYNSIESYVRSGRPYYVSTNGRDYFEDLYASLGPSRHYTFIFNVFVMM